MNQTHYEYRKQEVAEALKRLEDAKKNEIGNVKVIYKEGTREIVFSVKPHNAQKLVKKLSKTGIARVEK